jgi:hypothetical protein
MEVTGQHDILLLHLCGKEYLEDVMAKIEIMPFLGLRSLLSIAIISYLPVSSQLTQYFIFH